MLIRKVGEAGSMCLAWMWSWVEYPAQQKKKERKGEIDSKMVARGRKQKVCLL
jgi:hypothetical protein